VREVASSNLAVPTISFASDRPPKVVQMTETNSTVPVQVFHDDTHSVRPWILKFNRFATAFVVTMAIVASWHNFGLLAKLLAVVLLANVLLVPTLIRLREKRSGNKMESSVFEQNGYLQLGMMAMLMILLFSRNH
jgi:hypothetical protein